MLLWHPGVAPIRQSTPSAGIPRTVAALVFRGVLHFGYPVTDLNSRVFYPDVNRLPDADDSVRNRGRADSK